MRFAKLACSAMLVLGTLTLPAQSRAQVAVGISVRIGPPLLPVYEQPLCPDEGYIWVPGYWAWGDDGYFCVPGTWVLPPEEGLLWTPGYWAWQDDAYVWYAGYWGPTVGFYGGIDYGFGYPGTGFYGGYWRSGRYFYNRNVTNVDVTIVHNTYNTTVVRNTTVTRVSFNGGSGGTTARPTQVELAAAHQRHVGMTSEQVQFERTARSDRSLSASVNHGRPDTAATPRPSEFKSRGNTPTLRNDNANRPPENRGNNRADNSRPENRPPDANPNNPVFAEKQQREQEKLRQQQDSERERMMQRQGQERQKLDQGKANDQRKQELQQRHQQQQQQLEQKHSQQTQKLQQRQQKESQQQPPKQQERPPHNQP